MTMTIDYVITNNNVNTLSIRVILSTYRMLNINIELIQSNFLNLAKLVFI